MNHTDPLPDGDRVVPAGRRRTTDVLAEQRRAVWADLLDGGGVFGVVAGSGAGTAFDPRYGGWDLSPWWGQIYARRAPNGGRS